MRPRRPHRPRLGRSSRIGRPAHWHAPGSRQQYGASSSPQKLLSGTHGVDDDDCGDALNVANLENKGSPVGSQEHGETIAHIPGSDGVVIGVKDVGLAQAVLQRRSGNDRIVHRSKVTCGALCGRGVWSRGDAGGCRRFDCPVGVRIPQMPWATSASSGALMSVRLPGWRMPPHQRRPVASAGWCHDRRLFRGRYGIYRQPRRGDLGASVLVRAGCGEGECGGARLVGSEKSPIVTLRWCVGLGGLIENVLSRRGLRSPTELSGGASVICGNAQSARIAVPVCGWDAPPDAAGTVRRPVAARALREASGSRCVRMAGLCRRSLSAPGMDCDPPRLSQSDSRLYAVKLTEPDSITILSAYDST